MTCSLFWTVSTALIVDLLGFSYGGLIAQRMAVLAPHRVRGLILASTTVVPVVESMFAGWAEYERRNRAIQRLDHETTPGRDVCHRMAAAQAPLDIWRAEVLPEWQPD